VQVNWKGVQCVAGLQEVVLWAQGIQLGTDYDSRREQCSHLCAHTKCYELLHLIAESERLNQQRKNCQVWVDCPHSGCLLKVRCCPHNPMCIKFCDGYTDCEDFVARGLH
jgi:hypothetical protein